MKTLMRIVSVLTLIAGVISLVAGGMNTGVFCAGFGETLAAILTAVVVLLLMPGVLMDVICGLLGLRAAKRPGGSTAAIVFGVLIGGAFSGIVTSLTENFINPLISFITGAVSYTGADIAQFASNFVSTVINFLITALILFFLLKGMNKLLSLGKKPAAPAAPTTKKCPYCQSEIPIAATRCPHCTSVLEEAEVKA